jgi:anti-sigma-K factor RskA
LNCEELRSEYGTFALGIAEDPVLSEISAHLARECPDCAAGVRSALTTVAAMSGAVKDAEPSKQLRRRIAAMVAPQPKHAFALLPWAVSALLAIVLLSVAVSRRNRQQPAPDTTKLAQALTILNDPATKDVIFGDPAARGRVFVNPKGVVLIAAHMPKLESNRTFELWLLPSAGNPVPAGTFRSDAASDAALYVYQGQTANTAAVAVTVEPEGGSPQPTTTPFIVSKL